MSRMHLLGQPNQALNSDVTEIIQTPESFELECHPGETTRQEELMAMWMTMKAMDATSNRPFIRAQCCKGIILMGVFAVSAMMQLMALFQLLFPA